MAITGRDKSGKTTFGCTSPGPLMVFNTDQGDKGVITPSKFPGKEIVDITPGSALVATDADENLVDEAWDLFKEVHDWCIKNGWNALWDKADQIWELARLKILGRLTNVRPHHYAEVNNTFRYLIKEYDKAGLNLLLLHNVKEEWINEKYTGRLIRAGFKETGGLVDTAITTFFEDGIFGGRIEFCRQNMDLCGEELSGIEWDYDTLLERIFDAE